MRLLKLGAHAVVRLLRSLNEALLMMVFCIVGVLVAVHFVIDQFFKSLDPLDEANKTPRDFSDAWRDFQSKKDKREKS